MKSTNPIVVAPGPRATPVTRLDQRLTLHQLRVFLAVVEAGSFSRGAEQVHLSQSTVSHQVQSLGHAVGRRLFQSSGRGARLTAAGEVLAEQGRRILGAVEQAEEAFAALDGLRRGVVRVAGDTTVGIYVLPDALGAFHHRYPLIKVELSVANRDAVLERLVGGELDYAVVGRLWTSSSRPIAAEPLLDHELIAVAAPHHPLVGRGKLPLAALAGSDLVLRERGSGTRESTEDLFHASGLSPIPALELASNGAVKRAAARGLGVSVLSRYAVRLELHLGLLVELQVEGFPVPRRWHLAWLREREPGPAAAAFREFLHEDEWRRRLADPLSTD
jgi:DNA-binding transcriptional LysR family regulator